MKSEMSDLLGRLGEVVRAVKKEKIHRERFAKWLHTAMKNGLAGVSEDAIKSVLEKRFTQRAPAPAKKAHIGGPSPARLKLQGLYIGAIHSLTKKERARVKTVLKKDGVRPAIAFAKRLRKEMK